MPAIFSLIEKSGCLALKNGVQMALWLHFHPAHLRKHMLPDCLAGRIMDMCSVLHLLGGIVDT
eukprot:2135057-Karenia_brevis.AAC.1